MIDLSHSRNLAARPRPSCFFALLLLAGLLTASAQAGVIVTTLHSFSAATNGQNPQFALVQGNDGNLYGTTRSGGLYNYGNVFKIGTNGALTSLYSFTGTNDGGIPEAALVQGSDGNFYGTTWQGGTNNVGTVFRISSNGVFTSLYSFGEIPYDGSHPEAALVQGSDGNLYGTTSKGGTADNGNVFQISTNGSYHSLWDFLDNTGGGSEAALVQGRDGYLYVPCPGVWDHSLSAVFKISTNGVGSEFYRFGYATLKFPGGLVQGSDGNFYGMASYPPATLGGFVFEISTNAVLTNLYSFSDDFYGIEPNGLVQGSDGYLYGTTSTGGDTNLNDGEGYGFVFKISTNGVLNTLCSFTNGNDGSNPEAALVQSGDGSFYGTTYYGGGNDDGTVFQITTNGALTSLYSFPGGYYDGAWPQAVLAQGSDGDFYGTTYGGGTKGGYGTVFRINADGTLSTTFSFDYENGSDPSGLVQGSDGNLYGTTYYGGTNLSNSGLGTVFRISANGGLTSLYSFAGGNDGEYPTAGLAQGGDGNLYGTTSEGGTNNVGTVFKISTQGAETVLCSFTGGNNGADPNGLLQGSDGYLYGTTYFTVAGRTAAMAPCSESASMGR